MEKIVSARPSKENIGPIAIELDAPTIAVTCGLHEVWLKAKKDDLMPRKRTMAADQLKELMPFVYIMNILDDGADFSVRFMGSAIAQSLGGDYTNIKMSDFASHPSTWRTDVYRKVMARKAPMVTAVDLGDFEREYTKTECILLPLANDAGEFTMIMCAAAPY